MENEAPADTPDKFLRVDRGQVVEETPPPMARPNGQSDSKFYTEEDIANARRQEKDKLYGRLETMQEQVARLEAEAQKLNALASAAQPRRGSSNPRPRFDSPSRRRRTRCSA